MADKEKNLPEQKPENLENEIKEQSVLPENEIPVDQNEPAAAEESSEATAEEVTEEAAEETAEENSEAETEQTAEQSDESDETQPEASDEAVQTEEISEAADPVEESAEQAVLAEENSESSEEDSTEKADDGSDASKAEPSGGDSKDASSESEKSDEAEESELGITVGEDGEISLKEQSDETVEDQLDDDYVDPEDLVIYDEVVAAIKAEGAKLDKDKQSIESYLKHSEAGIKEFELALSTSVRAYETNCNEKETTAILAGIIKICGKILEIRCDNLENLVRVKDYNFVKKSRTKLHEEIDRYNDYVITYASLTGEQLTRLSTFLPESISTGKSLSVVPRLSFKESYVQVLPDKEETTEDKYTRTVIEPSVSAELILENLNPPKSRGACGSYGRKIKRATKRLAEEIAKLNKTSSELKFLRKRYDSELDTLKKRTPLPMQATDEYKNRVFEINLKYGRKLVGIDTLKAENAFNRSRVRLLIKRFLIEREKLVLAYEYMRNVYRVGEYNQRKTAERLLMDAIDSYNKCAELCTKVTGSRFDKLPKALVEQTCRGDEIQFPKVAYKRELVETVGSKSRAISLVMLDEVAPDLETYAENCDAILKSQGKVKNAASLTEESAMSDRAAAIGSLMISALRESSEIVVSADEFQQFEIKCEKAIKYFNRARKQTERAISRAFDENGVITALVENLRVIANLIEVRRICITTATRINRVDLARAQSRSLYKNIELYNGRAIDYNSIVGEQFSRIAISPENELQRSAEKLKVPVITYRDNYIEVFPKDPLEDSTFEKPKLWRAGIYTPLLMQHFRLTENRAVETTVINAPFVFDVMVDDLPALSWWHPIGLWEHLTVWTQPIQAWWNRFCTNVEIWFVDESLIFSKSGLKGRQRRNDRKRSRYDRKLYKLNTQHKEAVLNLETLVHESDRHGVAYQRKLYQINDKFNRKIYRLKVRWMRDCTGRNAARLLLERLVLERERLSGINKVLLKYRNYGRITFTKNILVKYKKRFIDAITAHNNTARKLSEMLGVQFAEVSTSVADEIIRYGRMIKFPEIVCCREVIETVDGKERTVGDRWHGYGLYSGTSGSATANANAPIMSVGAMGYATDMGVPFLKADFDGMTIMGMTPAGVPLIGFSQTGETSIPFTGIPMMLTGSDSSVILDAGVQGRDSLVLGAADVTDPHSGINKRGVDDIYTDESEEEAKDIYSGIEVETPLDLEAKMIEERFTRALRARSMTTVDNLANWWKLVGSEINVRFMRRLFLRRVGFLRNLLPPRDEYLELVNLKVSKKDAYLLADISKLGGVIDIECKRMYSAVKTGVRRSQRVWSAWLHDDIEYYNELVREFNKGKERYMQLELLSLNIPDNIKHRTEDRPPAPPILSLRNRVKQDPAKQSILTDEIYNKIVEYAIMGAARYRGPVYRFWCNLFVVPRLKRLYKRDLRNAEKGRTTRRALGLAASIIGKRASLAYIRRQRNEGRHYRIRYEKARAMRRYNRRTLRAVGVANDPIKYQSKVHSVLRKYLAKIFRIDYNMRVRQLVYRALRITPRFYFLMVLVFATIIAIVAAFFPQSPALQTLVMIGLGWSVLPIVFVLLRIVYQIVMFIANFVLMITRNIILIRYGARDIERNRYGAVLDCFVTDQYRLLLACERLRLSPKNTQARKLLIRSVNEYNKRAEVYSDILRVPISQVEITSLIDKLTLGGSHELTELQSFTYVRELVERVDKHKRGKTLSNRELGQLVNEINGIINSINLVGSDNQVAVDFLQMAMQKLISHVQTGIKPTQNERFEMKRDLIQGINQFDIAAEKKEIFARDVIKIVDQLGGRDGRRIISVLAVDDMIIS